MFCIKYILEPGKILYFCEITFQFIKYTNNIRLACIFKTREEALKVITLLKDEFNDFLNAEVSKFEIQGV